MNNDQLDQSSTQWVVVSEAKSIFRLDYSPVTVSSAAVGRRGLSGGVLAS